MLAKYKFSDVFQENPDGTISPKVTVSINGVTLMANSMSIGKGVFFGGVDLHQYKNVDIAGEYNDPGDTLEIKGFYK